MSDSDVVHQGLLGAYRRIMRPLVRILIRHGVHYPEFSKVLKSIFVESATEDFGPSDRPNTRARISMLTGLDRSEIDEQQKILASGDLVPKGNLNSVTRLLVGWHSDPKFTGPYGLPVDLPYQSDNGIDFESLVRTYAPEIADSVMLEELLRVGAVELTTSAKYKVLMRAYIPDSLHADGLERLGEVVQNFINTVETNMEKTRRGAGRFERVVYADDGLNPDLLPEFDKLLRTKGQQLLVELDNWLGSQEPKTSEGKRNIRTGVGIYHYIEEDDPTVE